MILNDLNVMNTCEYMYDLLFFILEYILSFPMFLFKSYMDYDDVMLTLSGLPPTFPYGRVDGVHDA
jgi:hypothetical protein